MNADLVRALILRTRYVLLLTVVILFFSRKAESATLSPDTLRAWNTYLEKANADLQRRVRAGSTFLWTFEDANRTIKVRRGEIVVGRVTKKNAGAVPGGMIHHWTGAIFMPNVRVNDVVEVTRDYNRYKEFYRPSVMDSKLIAHTESEDRFSMLLMNKALFLQTALEAEYQVTTVRLDDRHVYSISRTTRVQEIKDFGSSDAQRVPEGEGSGYIWKLHTVIRFEERDGGVYAEVEVIALSRDIPAAVRFIAEPIVRSVSRNSLITSLQQTEQAVRGVVASNRPVPLSAATTALAEARY